MAARPETLPQTPSRKTRELGGYNGRFQYKRPFSETGDSRYRLDSLNFPVILDENESIYPFFRGPQKWEIHVLGQLPENHYTDINLIELQRISRDLSARQQKPRFVPSAKAHNKMVNVLSKSWNTIFETLKPGAPQLIPPKCFREPSLEDINGKTPDAIGIGTDGSITIIEVCSELYLIDSTRYSRDKLGQLREYGDLFFDLYSNSKNVHLLLAAYSRTKHGGFRAKLLPLSA